MGNCVERNNCLRHAARHLELEGTELFFQQMCVRDYNTTDNSLPRVLLHVISIKFPGFYMSFSSAWVFLSTHTEYMFNFRQPNVDWDDMITDVYSRQVQRVLSWPDLGHQ